MDQPSILSPSAINQAEKGLAGADESGSDRPVASPFLPGTRIQYAWDSTSLGYFKTCPRLYQYQMIEGWVPKDENVHLFFGGEFHHALETYDRLRAGGNGIDPMGHADSLRSVVRSVLSRTVGFAPDESTKAGKYKNRRTLLELVIDYLDKYERDPAETFILANGKPAVELSFKFELDFGPQYTCDDESGVQHRPYLLCGHLDRVVNFNDQLFGMDRKTTTTTPGQYFFAQFDVNNQMTLYTWASQIILGTTIKGMIIDACQILLEKAHNFARGMTFRTQDQLIEWMRDLQHWLALAEHYATEGYWPMNDTSCDKYGGCRFREICSKSPSVRKNFLKSAFTQLPENERWNPLKPR